MHANGPPATLSPDQVTRALTESDAFRTLPMGKQNELTRAMSQVFNYLGDAPVQTMAGPDFDQMRGRGQNGANPPPPDQTQPGDTAPAAPAGSGQNQFQRAAGATREMLGAIGFPDFTASLIQGTFQAIVDSSIQQMEAYANLLAETAKTVDTFMEDNISEDMARDHLTSNYGDIFQKDMSSGSPQMQVSSNAVGAGQLPSFLQDLGFDSPMDIDQQAVDEVVVPETRKTLAEMRHQSLATMVMMGINRIVVSDGEINAKLIFHVDATESTTLTFNDYKPTNWNLAGQLGGNAFGAAGIVVNTTTLNTQADVNMNAELTGEVRVRFKSDYFPLERFADSGAIQLINSHAKVPEPRPEPTPVPGTTNGDAAPLPPATNPSTGGLS